MYNIFFKKASLWKQKEHNLGFINVSQSRSQISSSRSLGEEDIEDFTTDFLLDLRSTFEHFVKAFNNLKKSDFKDVSDPYLEETKEKLKGSLLLYDLSDKRGFMIFRKGYSLVFSYIKPGRIKVHFLKRKPFGEAETFVDTFINAITNDTMSINWVHENHKGFVDINVLTRYYMRRFLQSV